MMLNTLKTGLLPGNRLTDNLYSYNWDSTNRLIGMAPWNIADPVYSFVYRADGLRIKKVKQAQQDIPIAEMLESGPEQLQGEDEEMKPVWIGYETNYLYDGQMPVCEQDFENGVLKQTRIHLLGARGIEGIITVPATGAASLNWLFYDGHGNMVRTMNTSFALSAFQWRGVWGERTPSTPGRGYCANLGHPEDETGLVYMRARYYEPTTGRFISEDPARDGGNWFLYADGDPVGKVDADGNASEWERKWNAFMLVLFTLAGALLGGGWSLVVQGISLVKAAEVAWRTGQAKTAQILAGERMIAWGIRSIIAGGIVLGIACFGQGMSEDDYIEWKDIIDEMLSYVDSLVLFEPQYK